MRHICLSVILSGLFVVRALADPLQIASDSPGAAERQMLPPAAATSNASTYAAASTQPNRGGGLGGGFIEFLAGGGVRRSPAPAVSPTASLQPVAQPVSSVSQPPPESLPPLTPAQAATLTPAQAAALGVELSPAPVARTGQRAQ
jgi:hypothetical protein